MNNTSDKPVSVYLSELEKKRNEEEIEFVYQDLLNIISPSVKNDYRQSLNKIKEELLEEDQQVHQLRKSVSTEILRTWEINLEYFIKEIETRAQVSNVIIPLLSFFIYFLIAHYKGNILGYIVKILPKKSEGITVVAVLSASFYIWKELYFKSKVNKFSKLLSLVKKAQIITDRFETYDKYYFERQKTEQSFMSKIKRISIDDAPADFSVNHDKY